MVGTAVRLVLFEQASSLDDPEKSTPSRHAAEEMGAIYATAPEAQNHGLAQSREALGQPVANEYGFFVCVEPPTGAVLRESKICNFVIRATKGGAAPLALDHFPSCPPNASAIGLIHSFAPPARDCRVRVNTGGGSRWVRYWTVTRQLPRSPTHPAATAAGTAQSPPCDNAAVLSNFSHENARPSMARLIVLKRTTENTCLYVKR